MLPLASILAFAGRDRFMASLPYPQPREAYPCPPQPTGCVCNPEDCPAGTSAVVPFAGPCEYQCMSHHPPPMGGFGEDALPIPAPPPSTRSAWPLVLLALAAAGAVAWWASSGGEDRPASWDDAFRPNGRRGRRGKGRGSRRTKRGYKRSSGRGGKRSKEHSRRARDFDNEILRTIPGAKRVGGGILFTGPHSPRWSRAHGSNKAQRDLERLDKKYWRNGRRRGGSQQPMGAKPLSYWKKHMPTPRDLGGMNDGDADYLRDLWLSKGGKRFTRQYSPKVAASLERDRRSGPRLGSVGKDPGERTVSGFPGWVVHRVNDNRGGYELVAKRKGEKFGRGSFIMPDTKSGRAKLRSWTSEDEPKRGKKRLRRNGRGEYRRWKEGGNHGRHRPTKARFRKVTGTPRTHVRVQQYGETSWAEHLGGNRYRSLNETGGKLGWGDIFEAKVLGNGFVKPGRIVGHDSKPAVLKARKGSGRRLRRNGRGGYKGSIRDPGGRMAKALMKTHLANDPKHAQQLMRQAMGNIIRRSTDGAILSHDSVEHEIHRMLKKGGKKLSKGGIFYERGGRSRRGRKGAAKRRGRKGAKRRGYRPNRSLRTKDSPMMHRWTGARWLPVPWEGAKKGRKKAKQGRGRLRHGSKAERKHRRKLRGDIRSAGGSNRARIAAKRRYLSAVGTRRKDSPYYRHNGSCPCPYCAPGACMTPNFRGTGHVSGKVLSAAAKTIARRDKVPMSKALSSARHAAAQMPGHPTAQAIASEGRVRKYKRSTEHLPIGTGERFERIVAGIMRSGHDRKTAKRIAAGNMRKQLGNKYVNELSALGRKRAKTRRGRR